VPNRDKVLLEWWENLQLEVGQVVEELDPEGLLAIGAPPREYSKEIDRLASLVVRDDVSEQSVLAVWERAYGPESYPFRRPDMLTSLSQHLLKVRDHQPRP
jgi:hypothetical protein